MSRSHFTPDCSGVFTALRSAVPQNQGAEQLRNGLSTHTRVNYKNPTQKNRGVFHDHTYMRARGLAVIYALSRLKRISASRARKRNGGLHA